MTRLLLALLLLPGLTFASGCEWPNVARVVQGFNPSATSGTITLFGHLPAYVLACPQSGPCGYVDAAPPPPPVVNVICLTPEQNAEAEARNR